jgi:hypothetical protein
MEPRKLIRGRDTWVFLPILANESLFSFGNMGF